MRSSLWKLTPSERAKRGRGPRPDRIHDSAKVLFANFEELDRRPAVTMGTVEAVVADERTLPATEMRAGRGRRDEVDLRILLGTCRITAVGGALALYEAQSDRDVRLWSHGVPGS